MQDLPGIFPFLVLKSGDSHPWSVMRPTISHQPYFKFLENKSPPYNMVSK